MNSTGRIVLILIMPISVKPIYIKIIFLSLFPKASNPIGLFFLAVVLFLASYTSYAQDTTLKKQSLRDSVAYWNSQLDVADIAKRIINNNTPRKNDDSKVHASIIPAFGYSLQTGFAGVLSTNLGFYTGREQSQKISSILSSLAYTQYKQVIFPIQGSIWTKKDLYNITMDWKYLNYPSITYGLGGKSKLTDGYNIDFNYIKLHQSVLRKIHGYLYAGLGFYYDRLWNIREINPPKGVVTDFEKYGLTSSATASGIAFRILIDTRTNQINPKTGWYVNITDRPNYKFLGSSNNWHSFVAEFRRYFTLPTHPKSVLALWSYNWLTLGGTPPYLLLPSTGWDEYSNLGRGYIQGRYRGRQMLYLEAEYRFGITHNGLLGGVVFANAQSYSKDLSKQFSTIEPAAGFGLRVKLNKFSGANLCVDYGFGIDGSRGFFVNLGEVF